jgi:hypothetical protein
MPNVILRDTISHQTVEYDEKTAERYLSHPVFGKRLEVVRVDKPEVLGQDAIIVDGEKVVIDKEGNTEPEVSEAPKPEKVEKK